MIFSAFGKGSTATSGCSSSQSSRLFMLIGLKINATFYVRSLFKPRFLTLIQHAKRRFGDRAEINQYLAGGQKRFSISAYSLIF